MPLNREGSGERKKKQRERERESERTEETTWVRAAPRYSRGSASDVISPADRARLPRRIPAPTVLLRAKWLIIIIIILYFLRFSGAPKPPKSKKPAKLI